MTEQHVEPERLGRLPPHDLEAERAVLDRLTPSEAQMFLWGYRCALWGIATRVQDWSLEDLVNSLYKAACELQDALPRSDGPRTDVGWKQLQGAIEDKVDEVRRR